MTTTKPNVQQDGYYQAKQAAAALGISPATLYRYTQRGICKASVRRSNGRQVWRGSELLRAWNILY